MPNIVGFGSGRISRKLWCSAFEPQYRREALEQRARDMLCRALNLRTTVAFVGSGTSFDEYGGWSALAQHIQQALPDPPSDPPHLTIARMTSDDPAWILFVLQMCRDWLDDPKTPGDEQNGSRFREIFDNHFRLRNGRTPLPCLQHLLNLPIYRFATTNYDAELELALSRRPHALHRDRQPTPDSLGFTHDLRRHAARLARFIVAHRRQRPDEVFHLHGRYDEPASIIATEADYRAAYLLPHERGGFTFRQTVELLLSSNPILFLGFSLRDPDFMRVLEFLRAADDSYGDERMAFALLPEYELASYIRPNGRSNRYIRSLASMEYFWHRFGVHVVPYACKDSSEQSLAFTTALAELSTEWRNWRRGWAKKPQLRAPASPPAEVSVYIHPAMLSGVTPSRGELARAAVANDITIIKKRLNGVNRSETSPITVLLGPGGCGKSYRALKLRDEYFAKQGRGWTPKENRFSSFFFWSSYYSDDWLSGVDALLEFLSAPSKGSRCERLREALTGAQQESPRQPALIVFDGFERVLEPIPLSIGNVEPSCTAQGMDIGRAYDANVRHFIDVLRTAGRAHIVLTTRLFPLELLSGVDGDTFARLAVRVKPLEPGDLTKDRTLGKCADRLCSLLRGHAYSLQLAKWWIKNRGRARTIEDLSDELRKVAPDRRPMVMVESCIRLLDGLSPKPGVLGAILERLAVFMSPVTDEAFMVCLRQAGVVGRDRVREWKKFFAVTVAESNVVKLTRLGMSTSRSGAYTLHPIVRGYVFHRLQGAKGQDMPNFTLSGFTTGSAGLDPGTKQAQAVVEGLFDALMAEAQRSMGKPTVARAYCRAAFGVMRSRMDAIAAARWCRYDRYIERSVRLANLVKQLSGATWDYAVSADRGRVIGDDGVLHAEELAWLINDLGLACCCEGNMYDAFAVWEYGYEINKVIEHGEEAGQFIVQSQLHLAHTFLELGELASAREYVELTARSNAHLGSQDYAGRIAGYMGVLEHLSGNTAEAKSWYKKAVDILHDCSNPRAESIFRRHWSDLEILLNRLDIAERRAKMSLSLAESGHHPDLVAYAHNTLGHVYRAQGLEAQARAEYDAALKGARAMGIRRLEADVLSEISRLALAQRDPEMARINAMRSLRIANECGLGLRQCHSLVVLGLANDMAGYRDLGVEYLRAAHELCSQSSYWLRKHEVEHVLREWGEDPVENVERA